MDHTAGTATSGQSFHIQLHGDWDLARKAELQSILDEAPADRPLTIDMRRVSYADSSFLSALALLARRFQSVPITLLGVQTGLKHVLKIMEFDRVFKVVDAE